MGIGTIFNKLFGPTPQPSGINQIAQSKEGQRVQLLNFNEDSDKGRTQAIQHVTAQVEQNTESDLMSDLRKIDPKTSAEPKYSVKVPLSGDPSKMTKEDYEREYLREVFKMVNMHDVTNEELNKFRYNIRKELGRPITISTSTEEQLRAKHKEFGELIINTSDLTLAYAYAGATDIMRDREGKEAAQEWAKAQARQYTNGAILGFYGIQANAVINTANGITEPARGILASTVEVEIPAIPRFTISDRSEYWQKDHKGAVGEFVTTAYVASRVGGAGMTTSAGRAIMATDAMYNIGAGAAGIDPTTKDENGKPREMGAVERTLRVTGGFLGGLQVSSQIKPTVRTGTVVPPEMEVVEAITPEGARVRVPLRTDEGLDEARSLNSSMYGDKYNMFGSAKPSRTRPSSEPNPSAKPRGNAEPIGAKEDSISKAAKTRQNESAEVLSKAGFDVEQRPTLTERDRMSNPWFKSTKKPDYLIEGEIFDCYAPRPGTSAENIIEHIRKNKVNQAQARRIVLNMEDSNATLENVNNLLINRPIRDLQEVIAIKDGKVFHLYPSGKPVPFGNK
jgi:hypothetical protein